MPRINNDIELEALLQRVSRTEYIAVDTETTGFDIHKDVVCGYVLTFSENPAHSYYWPVRHETNNVPKPAAEAELKRLLAQPDKTLIFHNAAFDLAMLKLEFGNDRPVIEDTMVGRYVINEQAGQSLEACCHDFNVQIKKGSILYQHLAMLFGGNPDRDQMNNFWRLAGDDPLGVEYACGDGTSTFQLWRAIWKEIPKVFYPAGGHTLEKVFDLECKLIPVLNEMRLTGIPVDEERLAHVISVLETERDAALREIGDINVRSSKQIAAYLEKQNVTDWPETPTGKPSFPEWYLEKSEPGKKVLQARKRRTLLETFAYKIRDEFLYNGRVYPEFHQSRDEDFGTITGRLSSTKPNFQAQPGKRQGDLGRLFRSIYIPDPDMFWCESDYKTAEVRIATHYCHAALWEKAFAAGTDVYMPVADQLRIKRNSSKIVVLGNIMGMGAPGLALQLGCSQAEAKIILAGFYAALPELRAWQKKTSSWFTRQGYISTLLHRRLHLPRGDKTKGFTGPNRLTQGGNADVTKSALVRMDEFRRGKPLSDFGSGIDPVFRPEVEHLRKNPGLIQARLALSVHDSIGFFAADKASAEAMVAVMEDISHLPINIPMPCEWGNALNWGDATFAEDGWV